MAPDSDLAQLPLRPAVLHILLALAAGALHGLGIAEEVERASDGLMELGPGTLYRSLADMASAGLIRSVPAPLANADPRRKYYGLTDEGRRALAAETSRLEGLVARARARNVMPEPA